ncbi:MAG: phosphatase PAP2 family protein [Bacillota bacterium]|nr:PAP2 family protein [Bacillota bacterium]HWR56448.1 phosphatase PAP2 family protein [Negativicutes bacterium]
MADHTEKQKGKLEKWLQALRGISDPATRLALTLSLGAAAAAFCLWMFAEIAEELLEDELAVFDTQITGYIHSMASPVLTRSMKIISDAGGNWIVLGLVGLSVAVLLYRQKQHFWDAALVQICLWGGFLFNYGLKYIFKRERPPLERLVDATGFSFPSGHSMVSFAFYGLLFYLAHINLPRTWLRAALLLLIGAFIILVGISRIYLGVHYPSDVVAGFAAGGAWLAGCIVALEAVRHYKGKKV